MYNAKLGRQQVGMTAAKPDAGEKRSVGDRCVDCPLPLAAHALPSRRYFAPSGLRGRMYILGFFTPVIAGSM